MHARARSGTRHDGLEPTPAGSAIFAPSLLAGLGLGLDGRAASWLLTGALLAGAGAWIWAYLLMSQRLARLHAATADAARGRLDLLRDLADGTDLGRAATQILSMCELREGGSREPAAAPAAELLALTARSWSEGPAAAFVLGPARLVLAANEQACALFGRMQGDLVARPFPDFIASGRENGDPRRLEILRPDGSRVPIQLLAHAVHDDEGAIVAESCVAVHLAPDAGGAASERWRSDPALEAMARLASGVAHDFNNQLTAILGHCYILAPRFDEADPVRASVEEIRTAAERGRRLTQQLLAFSRKQVSRQRNADASEIVRVAEESLRTELGPEARLELALPRTAGLVRVDLDQMRESLVELVRNAREAGGARVRVRIELEPFAVAPPTDARPDAADDATSTQAWVLLRVSDDGPGMGAATRAQAFEPFFTTRDGRAGAGMGLATVYGIVAQHRGRMRISSENGRGTTIELWLPLADALDAAGAIRAPESDPDPARAPTVCVVEDDAQVRRLAIAVLRREGLRVLEASNGREAIERFETCGETIDVVLTDVNMPHMGGLELAAELAGRWPRTRIVYMSGFVEDDSFRIDFNDVRQVFLQKPFAPQELVGAVRRVLASPPPQVARRVLVVDDEDLVRRALVALLELMGYECVAAEDGLRALEILKSERFDLVISDLVMPRLDGLGFCTRVRAGHPNLPIIAMSGKAGGTANLAAAKHMGASATLGKPFSRDELELALSRAFSDAAK
jgi:CheY-like chemotaxis protein/signal transduction histidine kinase